MKKGLFLLIFCSSMICNYAFGAELIAVDFTQKGDISYLTFSLDEKGVKVNKLKLDDDKQIILDFENTSANEKVMRAFDTSEFSGSVVFVSTYKRLEKNGLRVAIQLRDNVRSILDRKQDKIILKVENRFGVFNQDKVAEGEDIESQLNNKEFTEINIPKSEKVEDILENLTLSGQKKYIGKKISINVRDVEITDILKMIADSSGFNIIITEEVKKLPPLTLSLNNTHWDQVLDTILGLNKLVAKKNGVILMITTLEKAKKDKLEEIEAKKISEKEEALVTKIFPISYADTESMSKILEQYLTKDRGKISIDERTNALIVKDTVDVIEKVKKIVEALDTQTPQVLIESKIVEVSESYTKEIGLQNGISFGYDPVGEVLSTRSFVGGQLVDATDAGPGFSFSSSPATTGTRLGTAFGLSVAKFGRLTDLAFNLQMLESESKAKVIATPKIVTQNKKKAKIDATDAINFTTSTTSTNTTEEASTESEPDQITAPTVLEVTPQVTNEGSIVLEVSVEKTVFGAAVEGALPPTQSRKLETNVLVDNGSTIVLGGLFSYNKSDATSGIPFLRDLPLVGWLFRSPDRESWTKNELVIFLTPRIINQEEAGFTNSEKI